MKTVGLKTLKDNLGSYVAEAHAGERIVITDRGREVAELGPLSPELRSALRLMAQGGAQWSGVPATLPQRTIAVEGSPLSEAVIEDRR